MNKLFLPALRGKFGDWIYYSCLMPIAEVASRIQYASVIHTNHGLSDMIQRQINLKRAKDIASYILTEEQRFFNSLVVAVYGGKPIWFEAGLNSVREEIANEISLDELPDSTKDSIGLLVLSGDESLYAIDGQHRLSGIKRVIETSKSELEDEVSVIFVAHSAQDIQRTRRLFTTLNKTAKPVGKGDRIALDEDDVMAIITRRLVEEDSRFNQTRVAFKANNNMPKGNQESLTTIGNLYDVLTTLFSKIKQQRSAQSLRFNRPSDKELDEYYSYAIRFFEHLSKAIPELKEFFTASNYAQITRKYRNEKGGSVAFRPIGLSILVELIEQLTKSGKSLEDSIKLISKLPFDLNSAPYANTLWRVSTRTIDTKQKTLVRRLLLCMLDNERCSEELRNEYAEVLNTDPSSVTLPKLSK